MIKFFNFTLHISTVFLKVFLPSGASAPRSPTIACPYYSPWFYHSPARKFKKFSKFCIFSRIFSIIFQIFINFDAYFWKITPNFRALSNNKILFYPRKIGPPKHLADPLDRKILHALLFEYGASVWFHLSYC